MPLYSNNTVSSGTWTPTDASGAALTFSTSEGYWMRVGNMVFARGVIAYPATANGIGALIGGLPFTVANLDSARQGFLSYSNSIATQMLPTKNGTTLTPYTSNGVQLSNAQCSTNFLFFTAIYPVA